MAVSTVKSLICLESDGKVLVCSLCCGPVSATEKTSLTQHSNTEKHRSRTLVRSIRHPFPRVSASQQQFNKELCQALLAADIPLHKLEKPGVTILLG